MVTEEQKLALCEALQKEYERLPKLSAMGTDNHREQYEYTIRYLKEGELYINAPEEWELYWAALEDLEGLINDYL